MKKYDKYKKTRNIWFPELPSNWILTKVKYVARTIAGGTPSTDKPEFWDNGNIPWLPSGKLQNCDITTAEKFITEEGLNNSSTKWIKPNTTLIALTGATCANIGYLKFKACANQSVVAIDEVSEKSNSRFMYYMFLSMRKQILTHQSGGAQAGINDSNVKNLYMALPSLEEQTKIAHYLDNQTAIIDQVIKQKEKLIELLKEKRQAVINEAVTKGLNPNAKMKDSGIEWLGAIPEHWRVSRLKHISSVISKGTTPSTEGKGLVDEGIRYLKAENIKDLEVSSIPEFFIDDETHEILKRSQLQGNDILFVIAGATIGKVAILPKELTPANTNQAVSFVRLKENENHKFVHYWLMSSKIYDQIWLKAVQSAQPNLSMENLGNFPLPYPSLKEQKEIVNFLNSKIGEYEHLIINNLNLIEKLKEYRQSIISEVVTGKIDVRDWQPNKQQVA